MHNEPTLASSERRTDDEQHQLHRKMGHVVVFRIMSLEGRPDVEAANGLAKYIVNNPNYPEQGDFVFWGENALDKAATYGYPHKLGQLYAIQVAIEDLIIPHPKDAPHVAYIKNGSQVEVAKLAEEHIDRFLADPNDPELQSRVIEDLFGPTPSQTSEK